MGLQDLFSREGREARAVAKEVKKKAEIATKPNPRSGPSPANNFSPYSIPPTPSQSLPPPYTDTAPLPLQPGGPRQTFHIYNDHILDPSKLIQLYSICTQRLGPSQGLSLLSAQPPTAGLLVGTAAYHRYASDIDLVINLRPLVMTKSTYPSLNSNHTFISTLHPEWEPLQWRKTGMSLEMMLEFASMPGGECLARFETPGAALTKWGQLHLGDRVANTGEKWFVEEILVTLLAKVELHKRRLRSGTPGHGGGFSESRHHRHR